MVCVKCDVEKRPVRGGYDDDGDDGDDGGDDGGGNDSYFGHLKVWSVVSLDIFNANCHLHIIIQWWKSKWQRPAHSFLWNW